VTSLLAFSAQNIFFSTSAQLSHGFTGYPNGAPSSHRCMFLASVCCGKQCANGSAIINGYDSSLAGTYVAAAPLQDGGPLLTTPPPRRSHCTPVFCPFNLPLGCGRSAGEQLVINDPSRAYPSVLIVYTTS